MSIRPHRDAGRDGVTVITDTGAADVGYAAFTDAELTPHTDGTSLPGQPGLLLLACQQPASHGGSTLFAEAARVTAALAAQHPDALAALSAPHAARFGAAGGYLRPVCEPAGPGRARIRLARRPGHLLRRRRPVIPLLRTFITQYLHVIQLRAGQVLLVSNSRWLHGRDRCTGPRVMLRILGPLPGSGIQPGFPAPAPGTETSQAA
jgi:alpha-ketoglutarate-dependent taurine dioxygenase